MAGAGANVGILDVNEEVGNLLVAELNEYVPVIRCSDGWFSDGADAECNRRACFASADVSNWNSLLTAFETVYGRFGSLDVVYANAGINSFDNLLEDEIDEGGRLKAPALKNVEINFHGPLLTTKAAVYFFQKQGGQKKYQLVITGSAARYVMQELAWHWYLLLNSAHNSLTMQSLQ